MAGPVRTERQREQMREESGSVRPGDLSRRSRPPVGPSAPGRRLTWAALAAAAAVLLAAVWTADRQPVGDRTVGEVTRVGVATGDSIPGYLNATRDELAALPTGPGPPTYALVAFSAYLAPDRLLPTLGDVAVSQVFGRVPLPGRQTEIVRIPALRIPDDVLVGMTEVAQRKELEARDYRARSAALTGGDAADDELRQVYDSGAEVATAESVAYRSGCSCLYAAVVRAEPDVLRTLAERPGVRAIDPAAEVERLDRTVFLPPLPEQQDLARPPGDSAIPSAVPVPTGEPRATSVVGLPPASSRVDLSGPGVADLTVVGVLSGVVRIGFAS